MLQALSLVLTHLSTARWHKAARKKYSSALYFSILEWIFSNVWLENHVPLRFAAQYSCRTVSTSLGCGHRKRWMLGIYIRIHRFLCQQSRVKSYENNVSYWDLFDICLWYVSYWDLYWFPRYRHVTVFVTNVHVGGIGYSSSWMFLICFIFEPAVKSCIALVLINGKCGIKLHWKFEI